MFGWFLIQVQTELTCQRIQELETQASSDLEQRNNKIEELTRTNEELKHRVQEQSKVTHLYSISFSDYDYKSKFRLPTKPGDEP